jgi:hypothetical protein
MGHTIYFGNVEVENSKTKERKVIERQIFKANDSPDDHHLRSNALKGISKSDRRNYRIVKLDFDTSKAIGETVYQ